MDRAVAKRLEKLDEWQQVVEIKSDSLNRYYFNLYDEVLGVRLGICEAIWQTIIDETMQRTRSPFSSWKKGSFPHVFVGVDHKHKGYTILKLRSGVDEKLVGSIARICNEIFNDLLKQGTVKLLTQEVKKLKDVSAELEEKLHPMKLERVLLKTVCDSYPT